jgi:hypothetical protein
LGADIDLQDVDGATVLHLTAANGETKLVELLLIFGANVNQQDSEKLTALHLATLNGHTDTMKVLIAFGANTELKSQKGNTALMLVDSVLADTNPEKTKMVDMLRNPELFRKPEQLKSLKLKYAAKRAAFRVKKAPTGQMAQQCMIELNSMYGHGSIVQLVGSKGESLFTLSANRRTNQAISGSKLIKACFKHFRALYQNPDLAEFNMNQRISHLALLF